MTIEKTLDLNSKVILTPENVYDSVSGFPELAVSTWSQKTIDLILENMNCREVANLDFGQNGTPVYVANDGEGNRFALYYGHLGGPAAAAQMEEVIAMGAKKFLCFGSCGCLDEKVKAGAIIVPTEAYRDEGTSYHYVAPQDFIKIRGNKDMAEAMRAMGIEPLITKVWTTDALYRETEDKVKMMKAKGCRVVDMECASLAAVAKYNKVEYRQFFYVEDNLGGDEWDPGLLGKFTTEHRVEYIKILKGLIRE